MNVNEMSRASTTQEDQQSKTPFYVSEQNQDKPVGYLFLDNDTLILEFQGTHPDIRIKQAKARTVIEFIDDSCIRIELPDNPGKKARIYLKSGGEGRFAVYGIRDWTGIDGTEPRAVRKQMYLARLDSTGAKLTAFWQLVLPYAILGLTYLMHAFVVDSTPELEYFVTGWQRLALNPIIAVHFAFLLIPATAILLFSRLWGLRAMFMANLLLVFTVVGCGFLPNEWQFLPVSESTPMLPEYWLIFAPYIILLVAPAFYFIIVLRRM